MKNKLSQIIAVACLALGLTCGAQAMFIHAHGQGIVTIDDIVSSDITAVSGLYYPAVYGSDVWDYRDWLYGGNKVWIDFDTDYGALNTQINCGSFAVAYYPYYTYIFLYLT